MDFLAFNTKLSEMIIDPQDRRKVAAAVCAQYVADQLAVPSTCPDSFENYYSMSAYVSEVVDILGPLNEKINMDLELAKEYTRRYWMLRMTCVFPGDPTKKKYGQDRGYFDTMMGAGIYIDNEQSCFVNQYKKEIIDLYCILYQICKG